MQTPKIDIVVTRIPALVALLIERGTITADTRVVEHATAADVRGRHVVGLLPHHLASRAASITEIPIRVGKHDREAMHRGDLALERLREIAGSPVTYVVTRVDSACSPALALLTAIRHVEEPHAHVDPLPDGEWLGLPVSRFCCQGRTVEVLVSQGVWHPEGTEPWLDGLGQETPAIEVTLRR